MEDTHEPDYQKPINDSNYPQEESSNYYMFPETNNNITSNTETPIYDDFNNLKSTNNKLPKWQLIFQLIVCFILIMIAIIDIMLQINNDYINTLLLCDDIAILGISLVFLFFNIRRRKFKYKIIPFLTSFIWLIGIIFKQIGMKDIFFENQNLHTKMTILFIIRTLTLFFYLVLGFTQTFD